MSRHEDDEQFRLFVQRQWGPLLRTAYLLTGDRGTAEDLTQSALEKTHRRWERILRRDAPEVYVRRVMVNTAISWRRRRRPLEVPLLTSDGAPTPDAYARVEERQLLLTALRRLPPRTQAVLVLRYFEDLSEADTARVLGCSVGSVKSQASRGLARLRVEFAPSVSQSTVRLEEEPA
ncbi:SigE family RNA polymerase sigma factor [Micromonospora schwarzwaldensis]|uniref:SigE family RNA polymerase sigma factor n=1 Tax=Micromonospora sp. DSM 45708 TaxID=3111767 RepID=UPI0031DE4FF5